MMASISLGDREHLANELAKKRHGGVVSRYIQDLVRDDYKRSKQAEITDSNKILLVVYQLLFYELLAGAVVGIGLSFFNEFLFITIPFILVIIGISCIVLGYAMYQMKVKPFKTEVSMIES